MLLLTTFLALPAAPLTAVATPPGQDCIVLVQDNPGLLVRQADTLHRLIDLLPGHFRLGLAFVGQTELLAPAPLTLARRADLHAALHLADSTDQVTERDWQRLAMQAAEQLSIGARRESHLVIIQQSGGTSVDWSNQSQALRTAGIMVTMLIEQPSGSIHPLVAQVGGQQRPLNGNCLSALLQQLGLGGGWLTQAVFSRDRSVSTQSFYMDDSVDSFVLIIEHGPGDQITLLDPSARPLPLPGGLSDRLTAAEYTCWHVSRPQEASDFSWVGDWQLTMPGQAEASLWLSDQVRLEGAVALEPVGRVVTASIWRGGGRMHPASLSGGTVNLRVGKESISLNDVGLNGDQIAGDGIFSAWLPDFIHPVAGMASLEVQGNVYRRASLFVPSAQAVVAAQSSLPVLPMAVLAMLVGGLGLLSVLRSRSEADLWQLEHLSSAGYASRITLGPRLLYAGSGDHCGIRLSAASGDRHLRFSVDEIGVKMEILQSEPQTMVNGERAYLRTELAHGDVVQLGQDRLTVERLANLRRGRR